MRLFGLSIAIWKLWQMLSTVIGYASHYGRCGKTFGHSRQNAVFIRALQKRGFADERIVGNSAVFNRANALVDDEVLFVTPQSEIDPAISSLLSMRPQLRLVYSDKETSLPSNDKNKSDVATKKREPHSLRWAAYHEQVNIDSCILETMHLGSKKQSDMETASIWHRQLSQRASQNVNIASEKNDKEKALQDATKLPDYMEGGEYQSELNIAVDIVSRVAYSSRSVQQFLIFPQKEFTSKSTLSLFDNAEINQQQFAKMDMTPVTIVDYGVQAIILSQLHKQFPEDTFIAEEDSSHLRHQPYLTEKVLDFIQLTLGGERWSHEQLYTAIDLGSSDERKTKRARTWVLDPIDGTKGFIRGEHYCIALALLDYEFINNHAESKRRPVLSVLGCPQLSLLRVLNAASVTNKTTLSDVFPPIYLSDKYKFGNKLQLFGTDVGTLFFAVRHMGAFMKSLDMPRGRGYQCEVSSLSNTPEISLCESREAMMATSRAITEKVRSQLHMTKEFVRLDGQCKHGLVGAGSVEGSLRLPPPGYIEKIWDHAPGLFFIEEAGGKVTDLKGREVDFSVGSEPNDPRKSKELDAKVKGVIVSNGRVHQYLIEAVQGARNALKNRS